MFSLVFFDFCMLLSLLIMFFEFLFTSSSSLSFLLLSECSKRYIFSESDSVLFSKSNWINLLSLQLLDLSWQDSLSEIPLSKLTIMIRSPCVNVTFFIYCSRCRIVKFTNDNLGKIYSIHAHFLRSAKDAKCTRAPHNDLLHVSYGCWKSSSSNARYVMNFELFEFYWRIEIRYRCTIRFTETHLLSPVRTHSIYLTLICEIQGVQVSSTHLLDSKF